MALNKWVGIGRITAPLELRRTTSGTAVLSFTIAVERDFKGQNGERETDFINMVAWRNQAEFISNYFDKGSLICVEGSIQTRSYTTQDGQKRTVTEILVDRVHFTGEKRNTSENENMSENRTDYSADGFVAVADDSELPF